MFDDTTTNAGISPADTALPKMNKVEACAEMLGVSESTVHRMLTAKKLRGKTPSKRLTLVYADSVSEYLASCPDR